LTIDIFLVAEDLGLFTFGQLGAETGARIKTGNARAAGAQFFRQRALRREMQLQFAGQHLTFELLVFAHVRGVDAFDLMGFQQRTHAEVIDTGIVADDGQIFGAGGKQGADQVFRYAAQTEAASGDRHAIGQQAVERGCRCCKHLVHCRFLPLSQLPRIRRIDRCSGGLQQTGGNAAGPRRGTNRPARAARVPGAC
jgi:hypothetical protein